MARLGLLEALVGRSACALVAEALHARGEIPEDWAQRHELGVVRRGVLIRQRGHSPGRAVAVDAAGPGGAFALEREEGGCSGYAATDLLVCLLPREVVDGAMSAEIGRDLLVFQQAALRRVERLAQARGAPSVRARVASLLVTLSESLSPRTRDRLPAGLQQRDLARLVSVRHETFCRALGELERAGVVRRDPEGLAIVDRARLRSMEDA